MYLDFFLEVVRRTAQLVAAWMCVGFCHGAPLMCLQCPLLEIRYVQPLEYKSNCKPNKAE